MPAVAFFATATLIAAAGLCTVALRDVPRITGTLAFIVTLAALALAIAH